MDTLPSPASQNQGDDRLGMNKSISRRDLVAEIQRGRCLVIDNHPIFGDEAKRNEFLIDGQRLTPHQGSAILLVPQKGGYTDRFYEIHRNGSLLVQLPGFRRPRDSSIWS